MLGNAHYNLGKISLELGNFKLSSSERRYFYSGLVYADIGRFVLDRKAKIHSDSKAFIRKMFRFACTEEEKWFCIGAYLHEFQDRKITKFLRNIFKTPTCGYLKYLKRCGILEYYFLNKNRDYIYSDDLIKNFEISSVLTFTDILESNEILQKVVQALEKEVVHVIGNFYYDKKKICIDLPENLFVKAYECYGLDVTSNTLKKQAANLVSASVLLCHFIGNRKFDLNKIAGNIEKEVLKLCKNCIKFIKKKMYFNL